MRFFSTDQLSSQASNSQKNINYAVIWFAHSWLWEIIWIRGKIVDLSVQKKTNKYSTHLDLEKYRIFQYEKQSFKPQIKLRQISWLVLSKIFLFIIWKKIVLRFGRTNLLYRQFFAVSFHDILSESRNKMSNNFTFLSISTLINTEWHPYSRRTASDSNKRHRRRPQECHRRRPFFWNKTNTIDWYRSEHCESTSVRNARPIWSVRFRST